MKIGLALSGGGIRGIAHAGVLKALEDNNIKVDAIGGTSSGSMVASLYAMGYSPYYIYILFKNYSKEIAGINGNPIVSGIKEYVKNKRKITGIRNGERIEEVFNIMAEKKKIYKISDVKMPLVIPAVDLTNSKEYIFTNVEHEEDEHKEQYIKDAPIGKAVRASSSFPGVFSPCKDKTHIFMDGGALDNIPVNEVKKMGVDKVIAVKFNSDEIKENSNVMDIVMKTIDIMGCKISEESLEMSDLVLNVYTDKVGLLDIKKLDSCYKYGYDCVIDNLDKIKELIQE